MVIELSSFSRQYRLLRRLTGLIQRIIMTTSADSKRKINGKNAEGGVKKIKSTQSSLFDHFKASKKEDDAPNRDLPVSSQSTPVTLAKPSSIVLSEEDRELLDLELKYLHSSWLEHLMPELTKPYFCHLKKFIAQEQSQGRHICPPEPLVYSWSQLCPLNSTRIVIIGQDPYHNDRQAMGLCFSVPSGVAVPPSLINIYKELASDISGFVIPRHGDLSGWARQGVLLLNTSLTVRAHEPTSHSGKGWEQFTDAVIQLVNRKRENVVFILWGSHAQKKANMIDKNRHLVLTGVHPSPLSAARGFFGCKHFSRTNEYLIKHGLPTIDWNLL